LNPARIIVNSSGTPMQPSPRDSRPAGHVWGPATAIAGLSLALAAGLGLLGVIDRANAAIAFLVSRGGAESFPNKLPVWMPWIAAAILAPALVAVMLATPALWRRALLWLTTILLVATWAPVLSLAAFAPVIAAPWIACCWSGVCALVYSANHRMPCDSPPR
jgi:hypothetical protein